MSSSVVLHRESQWRPLCCFGWHVQFRFSLLSNCFPVPTPSIHFDNAATSWPKPPEVIDAIVAYYRDCGRAAGRGGYSGAIQAESIVSRCREQVLQLAEVDSNAAAVFAHNGTDALNMAIHGMLRPGDHVVTTALEHNSVLRPLYAARDSIGVKLDIVWPDANGQIDPRKVGERIQSNTRLVCVNHASNVTGVAQDISAIGRMCRINESVRLLVDASQTLGKFPFVFGSADWDLLAAAGHKGMFGPLGTGVLVLRNKAIDEIRPVRQGGTGLNSESEYQPDQLPHRLESGNLDVGGIAGLSAGLDFVRKTGVPQIHRHEIELRNLLVQRLRAIDEARLHGVSDCSRVAICSLTFERQNVHEVAFILDSSFGIEVRAGLHCAPLANQEQETGSPRATLRISPGWYNTLEQIDSLASALAEIVESD